IKMLLGIDTVFSQVGIGLLNTTFFTAMVGLTYLCVDPILKAIYTLRCFYGESLRSGDDLKAGLKQFTPATAAAFAALFLFAAPLHAAENAKPAPTPQRTAVKPSDLDHAINKTIQERKYT